MSYGRRLKDVLFGLSQRYIKVISRCLEDVLQEMTCRCLIKRCLINVLEKMPCRCLIDVLNMFYLI